jgi:hypothetical protein
MVTSRTPSAAMSAAAHIECSEEESRLTRAVRFASLLRHCYEEDSRLELLTSVSDRYRRLFRRGRMSAFAEQRIFRRVGANGSCGSDADIVSEGVGRFVRTFEGRDK